jgi:UDP-N-acetylmuramate: L-alanyl-gamma-D-glutamyl-meso-diaminopimelate ligase
MPQKVHLIAIGGVGMASLAGLLREAGFIVAGSDQDLYPPMSVMLEKIGIRVEPGFRPENLNWSPAFAVVGNAVSRDNPEVQELIRRKIPYLSFPETLGRLFLPGKHSIVIAGTHGKTTTSSLVAWILHHSGRRPSFLVGGVPRNFGQGFQLGDGEVFVVEGDEYDTAFFDKGPKFLHYQPKSVLLTGLEFDHADIYRNLDQVKQAFWKLVNLIPQSGVLFYNADDPNLREIASGANRRKISYALENDATWRAERISTVQDGTSFDVVLEGNVLFRSHLPLLGLHNVSNALGALAVVWSLGLQGHDIEAALPTFRGVERRLERLGEVSGVTLFDDFAHHPTSVRVTLEALRTIYPHERLWAVFEPRSNTSRRRVFQREFVHAFLPADRVILAGVFHPEKLPAEERLSTLLLAEDLRLKGKNAQTIVDVDAICQYLIKELRVGDVVVMLSNGGFGGLRGKLLAALNTVKEE